MGVGQQRGGPSGTAKVGELGGPGLVGVAGQRAHPPGRYPGQVQRTGAEATDLVEAL